MDNIAIIVPDMPYMRDIFRIFRSSGFICEDCVSSVVKNYYTVIKENYEAYFKYFSQLGYYLEQGPGYFHLCEARPAQGIQSKLRTDVAKFIPMLNILIQFRPELAPGFQFKAYDLQMYCDQNDEIRAVLPDSPDGKLASRVTTFLKDVEKEGFIDFTSTDASTCMVTSAFRYLKELVLRVRLYDQHAKFNLDYEPGIEDEKIDNEAIQDADNNYYLDMKE
jgi:hypothetical protein